MKKRISVAAGREPADLVIKNGRIINVFTREIISGDVAIVDGVFVGIGEYEGKSVLYANGKFVSPSFIDGHVHIESAMVTPLEFAKTLLPHGVTAVIADPHEIANVGGTVGIRFMLDASEHLPFDVYYMLPSSVPATQFETSGAKLETDDLVPFLCHPRILGLAEVMNYPALFEGDDLLLDKILTIYNQGGKIDGHAAGLDANAINVYTTAMIRNDHESVSVEQAIDRLNRGMYLMIRQGSVAKDLETLISVVTDHNARRCLFVTDDKHLDDLLNEGSVDHNIRLAIKNGIHPITAIQMASINVAECFGLRNSGAIAPGYKADFLLISDLENVTIEEVYKNGKLVAYQGKIVDEVFGKSEEHVLQIKKNAQFTRLFESVRLPEITKEHLAIPISQDVKANVIGIIPNSLITQHLVELVDIIDGKIVASIEKDHLKLAVIERHQLSGNIGLGVVKGFGIKSGAIATTVGHDSHNVIIAGTNDEDMITAAKIIHQKQGGLTVVEEGKVLAFLPLSIAGVLSDQDRYAVISELQCLDDALKQIGASIESNPFLTLSFLALPVIPHLKLTDMGLFDVDHFEHIPIIPKSY